MLQPVAPTRPSTSLLETRSRGGFRFASGLERPLSILILEDNVLVSQELAEDLESFGHRVRGPYRTLTDARLNDDGVDAAILDIGIGDELSLSYANHLQRKGVPFVFYSGSSQLMLPGGLEDVPCCRKPCPTSYLLFALEGEYIKARASRILLDILPLLRKTALLMTQDQSLADDILETALLSAIDNVASYHSTTSLQDWLTDELIKAFARRL